MRGHSVHEVAVALLRISSGIIGFLSLYVLLAIIYGGAGGVASIFVLLWMFAQTKHLANHLEAGIIHLHPLVSAVGDSSLRSVPGAFIQSSRALARCAVSQCFQQPWGGEPPETYSLALHQY